MSSTPSEISETAETPPWLLSLLGLDSAPAEGEEVEAGGRPS